MSKTPRYDYDLLVIGSGAAGSVAAHISAKAGKRVGLIEADLVGGECPNIGCVPTKALLHAAEIYEAAKHGSRFGIRSATVGYNYPTIRAWKDLAVKRTGTYLGEEIYQNEGISLIRGKAYFIDPHTISVGMTRFSSAQFLVASGSKLVLPPIAGLTTAGFLTYREAINVNRPPKSLAIIGGGAVGCEFAQLFAIFGTKVYLIDSAPRLLAKEDPEASALLEERFSRDYAMEVLTSATVEKVEKFGGNKRLSVKVGSKRQLISAEDVLLATGKTAVVDIGLENAGVAYEKGHILVNDYLQTSAPHIWAAGDCVGPYQFTHMAAYQSRLVAYNLLHPRRKRSVDYHAVPRCIFTNPEIASVGLTEAELKTQKVNYRSALAAISVIGRANTADVNDGFVKVLADAKTQVLLGATIASPHAGEMIHELTLAIQHGLTANQVAETIHAFPTWSEAVRVACNKLTLAKS